MKQYLFIISLLFSSALFSQSLERTVIGSSGKSLSNANASLNFTIGELMVTTLSNGTTTLNQGFHQEVIILQLKLSPVAFLQGPLVTSGTVIMDDSLRSNGLLPTNSPYADSVTCEATVFDITGNNAIVDWVWISLRDKNDPTVVLASQSGLLQADGDIVSVDGTSALAFDSPSDSYYIAINHRNHIAVMSANTVALNTSTATTIDLSDATASVFGGSNSVVDMGNGIFAMIAGDFDENGQIQNTDTNSVIQLLGISGYSNADIDMNGQVQNSDINSILNTNIGKGVQF